MPISGQTKRGSFQVSAAPLKIISAVVSIYATYKAYRFVFGEPRTPVVAYWNLRSNETYQALEDWAVVTKERPLPIEQDAANSKIYMTGLTQTPAMIPMYERFLKKYSFNDLRLLHNYWLRNIDAEKSIYDWFLAEIPSTEKELMLKELAQNKFIRAGVGDKLRMKIPSKDNMLYE